MGTISILRVVALCAALGAFGSGCRKAEALPELGALRAFSLQDQTGRAVSAESFRDERDASHSDARRSASGYSDRERSAEHGLHPARVAPMRAGMIDVFA